MDEEDGRVVAHLVLAPEPKVEAVEEPFGNLVEGQVFGLELLLEELLHPALGDLVAEEGFRAVVVRLYDFSVLADEFVEEFHRGLDGFLFRCADLVLELECRGRVSG